MPVAAIGDNATCRAFDRYTGVCLSSALVPIGQTLIDYAARLHPRVNVVGFEVWSGVTREGDGSSYLHRDVDEGRKVAFGALRYPLASAILYLGPRVGLVGGQTLIWANANVPAKVESSVFHKVDTHSLRQSWPNGWLEIEHRPGRLVLFDGARPHLVAPVIGHPRSRPRVALLVNAWDLSLHAAENRFGRLNRRDFEALTGLSRQTLQALLNATQGASLLRCANALRAVHVLTKL
jgi:hypothetical protein